MSKELVSKRDPELTVGGSTGLPAVIIGAGRKAGLRFIEFFTAEIRNPNTRRAYHRAVCDFFRWCEDLEIELERIGPVHVAAYIEKLQKKLSRPSVKQQLAAIRMVFDYLVLGQVVPVNPAAAVRGPKYTTKRGKTPVLSVEEARQLLDSIDTSTVVGLRDRALIALMTFTFARVGAATSMDVEDWYFQKRRWWVRLHEKGGKVHEMPAHHKLEEYMLAYIGVSTYAGDKKRPLFRTAKGKTGQLTERRITQPEVYLMIRRRAAGAGIKTLIGCHTFRAYAGCRTMPGGAGTEWPITRQTRGTVHPCTLAARHSLSLDYSVLRNASSSSSAR